MIPAPDYEYICTHLTRFLGRTSSNSPQVRLVAVLFGRPTSVVCRDEMLPHLSYWHMRSKKNFNLYWAGYTETWHGTDDDYTPVSDIAEQWAFSKKGFDKLRLEMEKATRWKYSGGTDLLLTNARYDKEANHAYLDFTSTIAADLEKMKADGAIVSVPHFLEDIIRFAETQSGDDPTWGFSDSAAFRLGKSALFSLALKVLPKSFQEAATKAKHYAVRDISTSGGSAAIR